MFYESRGGARDEGETFKNLRCLHSELGIPLIGSLSKLKTEIGSSVRRRGVDLRKKLSLKALQIFRISGFVIAGSVLGFGVAYASGVINLPTGLAIDKITTGVQSGNQNSESAQPNDSGLEQNTGDESGEGLSGNDSSGVDSGGGSTDESATQETESISCPTGQIELSTIGTSSAYAYMPEIADGTLYNPAFIVPVSIKVNTSSAVGFNLRLGALSSSPVAELNRKSVSTLVSGSSVQPGRSKTVELWGEAGGVRLLINTAGATAGVAGWQVSVSDYRGYWADYSFNNCEPPRVVVTNSSAPGSYVEQIPPTGQTGYRPPRTWSF